MSEQPMNPMSVGLDDGYAFTKLALPDGRLVAVPSRARLGRANVTWLDNAEQRIFEYETEDQPFAVGEVDGEPTYFDAYPFSGLNRAHRPARPAAGGTRWSLAACGVRIAGEQFLSQGWQPAGEDRSEEAQQPHAGSAPDRRSSASGYCLS